jgi:RNase P subunit RPR2
MPFQIVCKGCEAVLFEAERASIREPAEVVRAHGGRCPRCGRTLREDVYEIVVEGVRLTVNGEELTE